jgi:hypothetical protein
MRQTGYFAERRIAPLTPALDSTELVEVKGEGEAYPP